MNRLVPLAFILTVLEVSPVRAATVYQAWTQAETDLFVTQTNPPANAGSGWTGNTLVLNYGSVAGQSAMSILYERPTIIPLNAIGLYFELDNPLGFGHDFAIVQGTSDVVNNQTTLRGEVSVANKTRDTFAFWNERVLQSDQSQHFFDIDTSTLGSVTTVHMYLVNQLVGTDIVQAPQVYIVFYADGIDQFGVAHTGTTTYRDVSWILEDGSDVSAVPEPSGMILGMAGIVTIAGLRFRNRLLLQSA